MSPQTEQLIQDLLRLPRELRGLLAECLLESLDEIDRNDVEALWREEVRQRLAEIDTGNVQWVTDEDVFRDLRDKYE
ncbi:MAG TPA: addiction module protein [Candidatus Hydrogenedentes bacterium]|nr:addiction module protein [Candidatus Hydrogenedentota bacterium]